MIANKINENEYAPYYKNYIDLAPAKNILESLTQSLDTVFDVLNTLDEEKWNFRYAADKWTIKEMILHIIDTERIMAYRALRIARNDMTALAGFEQDNYISPSKASERTPESLMKEYKLLRASTLSLFETFDEDTLKIIGNASNVKVSVRALGYIISGHEIHHLNVLQERYL